ncbi:MAG: hypothetical protein ACJ8GN_29395 [Longimicrobiaceae bacterium]
MKKDTGVTENASAMVKHDGATSDAAPPPDHADFVKVRSAGLRAVRENLARRKKVPGS